MEGCVCVHMFACVCQCVYLLSMSMGLCVFVCVGGCVILCMCMNAQMYLRVPEHHVCLYMTYCQTMYSAPAQNRGA